MGLAIATAWAATITTTRSATIAGVAGSVGARLLEPQVFTIDIARNVILFALYIDQAMPVGASIEREMPVGASIEREHSFNLEF
jgi:hypothetical protein